MKRNLILVALFAAFVGSAYAGESGKATVHRFALGHKTAQIQ